MMRIKEVMARTGLGRKALEYYQEKGLVSPDTLENGYRDYNEDEVERLCQAALLRALDVPLSSVTALLCGRESPAGLLRAREMRRERQARQDALLREWARDGLSQSLQERAEALSREETLAERFARLLPGHFGRMLLSGFAPYLQEAAQTPEQEAAFREAAAFLDGLPPLRLSSELARAVEEAAETVTPAMMAEVQAEKERAVGDAAAWLEENREAVRRYLSMKQSADYRALPVVRAGETLKAYLTETGFYARFIPLMRRLSPGYDAYCRNLQRADEAFRENIET